MLRNPLKGYKIFEISPQALTEDYELALQNLEIDESEDSASLKLISGALNLSLSVLELDRSQVFSHLTGRLLSFDLPRIKSITSQIKKRQSSVAWLCLVQPNLAPPSSYLFRTLLGHTGSVNTLALTKNELDELILISGSSDGTIRTWHLKTGNNIATYAHNAAVQGIVIKNDGKKLISAHRHSVSGAVGGGTSSFSMAINPGILKICDLDTGESHVFSENNPTSFRLITKTDEDEYLIVQSHNKSFKVLALDEGKEIAIFRGHCPSTGNGDDEDRFDFLSEMALAGFGVFDLGESPVDGAIGVIPGTKNVVSSWGNGSLIIWNVETGIELLSLTGHPGSSVSTLAFTKDGQLLVSGSSDKTIKLWDLNSYRQSNELKGHQSYVTALAVTDDRRLLASGSSDTTIKLWDLEQKSNSTLQGHSSRINSLIITPDKKSLISASNDATIKIWNLKQSYKDNENKFFPHHASSISGIDIFPDNQKLVSTSSDGFVKIWNLNTGELIDEGRNLWGNANGASVTPDGHWVISGSGTTGFIMFWNLIDVGTEFGNLFDPDKTFEGHDGRVGGVVVTPDGTKVISASDDRTLQVWDLRSQCKLLTLKGHENYVHQVAVTPDSRVTFQGVTQQSGFQLL